MQYKFSILMVLYFFIIIYMQGARYPSNIFHPFFLILCLHFFGQGRFRFFFLILFTIILAFDAYYALIFRNTTSMGIISSILETTVAEAKSVLTTLLPKIILILLITIFLVFLSANELGKSKISRKYSALLLAIYLFIGIPCYLFLITKYSVRYRMLYKDAPVLMVQYIIGYHFSPVLGTLSSIAGYYYEMYDIKNYSERERILPEGVSLNPQYNHPQNIYFVVGEAQCSRHMSIYGYPVKTTPFLDSLYNTSNEQLSVYREVYSPACVTRDALRILLTFATPRLSSPYFAHKNLIEMANDAGYQTLWLTSQNVKGGLYDSYAARIARSSNIYHFNGEEDLDLISTVKGQNQPDVKQFYFINLLGSHSAYFGRYDDVDEKQIQGDGIITDYDRSIHHTDRFIREFYKMTEKDTSSVFVYISDHGEIPSLQGHGFLGKGSSQFEVPFFIINRSKMPIDSIVNKYLIPGKNRLNSLSVTYILSELLGYSISEELLKHVHVESNYVYHIDNKFYEFKQIEAENE